MVLVYIRKLRMLRWNVIRENQQKHESGPVDTYVIRQTGGSSEESFVPGSAGLSRLWISRNSLREETPNLL